MTSPANSLDKLHTEEAVAIHVVDHFVCLQGWSDQIKAEMQG